MSAAHELEVVLLPQGTLGRQGLQHVCTQVLRCATDQSLCAVVAGVAVRTARAVLDAHRAARALLEARCAARALLDGSQAGPARACFLCQKGVSGQQAPCSSLSHGSVLLLALAT